MGHNGSSSTTGVKGSKPKRPALSSTRQIAEHFRDTLRECVVAPLSIFAHLDFMKNAGNKGYLPDTSPDSTPNVDAEVCTSFHQLGFCREYATCPMSHSVEALPVTMNPTCAVIRRRHTLRNSKCNLRRGDTMFKYNCYYCPHTVSEIRVRPWQQIKEHMKQEHSESPVMSLSVCRKECTEEEAELFWDQLELDVKGAPGEESSADEEDFVFQEQPESPHQSADDCRQSDESDENEEERHVSDGTSNEQHLGGEGAENERGEEVMQEPRQNEQQQTQQQSQDNDLEDKAYWDDWGDDEKNDAAVANEKLEGDEDSQREREACEEDLRAAEAREHDRARKEQERHMEEYQREMRARAASAGAVVIAQQTAQLEQISSLQERLTEQMRTKHDAYRQQQQREIAQLAQLQRTRLELHQSMASTKRKLPQLGPCGVDSAAERMRLAQHNPASNLAVLPPQPAARPARQPSVVLRRPPPSVVTRQLAPQSAVRPSPQPPVVTQQQLWHQQAEQQQQQHASAVRQAVARQELQKLRSAAQTVPPHLPPQPGAADETNSAMHVAGSKFGAKAVPPRSADAVASRKRPFQPSPEAPSDRQLQGDGDDWDLEAPKRKSVLGRSTPTISTLQR
eukprot:GEMP01015894.1.p1 GENE.GEMP01015894.1~~GEMP01015894.1.p1  ORF type:complete len:623 (-),score=214.03 GEMP01015894.1:769-2637(-)